MGRKKLESRPRLISISVTEDAHSMLTKLKHASSEPFWKVFDRIIGTYAEVNGETEENLNQAREGVKIWQRRALRAEKELELVKDRLELARQTIL